MSARPVAMSRTVRLAKPASLLLRAARRPKPFVMKLLFLGDVMGRAGRNAITGWLPVLRKAWALDFVVVNGENATGGAGLSPDHAKALLAAGADCVTLGDHAFDQRAMREFCAQEAAHHPAPEHRQIGRARPWRACLRPMRAGGGCWWRRRWGRCS